MRFNRTGIEPVCPHCGLRMVKYFCEVDEDEYLGAWLCGCDKIDFDNDVDHGYDGSILIDFCETPMSEIGQEIDKLLGE